MKNKGMIIVGELDGCYQSSFHTKKRMIKFFSHEKNNVNNNKIMNRLFHLGIFQVLCSQFFVILIPLLSLSFKITRFQLPENALPSIYVVITINRMLQ